MKYYYSRILALFIAVLCVNSAFSQDREILPKGLTEAEKGIISQYEFKNSRLSDPPTGPVRAAAEWEEVRARNGWVNIHNPGEDFVAFLENQETIIKDLMTKMGFL